MTRPKVDPDKRQRTAQACDSCKRRKQKCNGVRPCNTCSKRHLECLYTPTTLNHSDLQDPDGSPTKRRHVDDSPGMVKSSTESCHSTTGHTPSLSMWNQLTDNPEMQLNKAETSGPKLPAQIGVNNLISMGDSDFDSRSKISNTSGAADEAEVLPSKRMLEDQTGRLLYLGDSATLSYLQYIRLIVYGVLGNCDFTEDPNRHRIMEKKILLSGEVRPTGVLPDQKTARVLADSFFINQALLKYFREPNFFIRWTNAIKILSAPLLPCCV
ncbi:hypothetical protein F4778DRAFT_151498 [Xylariomycetidae sp. FL2044]|nr:hypothetical protein F4778DRAFT_151498 [Xylariomycetidae sp. FL2044]